MSAPPPPPLALDEGFDATLAFLDEYDGDLYLPDDVESSDSSNSSHWSPAPTAHSHSEPDIEADSESTLSPSGSTTTSPDTGSIRRPAKGKRQRGGNADDPRMRAKTIEEGAYPSRTRKAELTYLRAQVQELDEKLRVLKQSNRSSSDVSDDTTSEDVSVASSPADTDQWEITLANQTPSTGGESMWEDVAMRQFDQRQQAEIENQRLRSMLEAQLKLARGLERLLKRTNADLLAPTNRIKRPRITTDGAVDASAFDDMMGVIDEMYTQMETVFSDPRFDREDAPLRDIQVSDDPAFGTVVDVFDARNLPFDLRPTADAVWGYFASTSVSFEHRPLEITDDVIKKHFNFVVEIQRYEATFRGRLAGRRYFEDGRIVILWVAMIEPQLPGGSSDGMVVRQKGWTIIKRPNRLPPNCDAASPVARIQSKHVAIPFVYDDVPDHKRKVGTLTNFVLHSVYSHLQTSRKVVENILIENAMKK